MSKQLGKVFFPSNDPVLQALSFWGVFFVGYISRCGTQLGAQGSREYHHVAAFLRKTPLTLIIPVASLLVSWLLAQACWRAFVWSLGRHQGQGNMLADQCAGDGYPHGETDALWQLNMHTHITGCCAAR